MLPLHLSQLFTGISGFSSIILPSPADTLSKAMQQKSHSVFLQYLLLTLTASFGSADGKQLLFLSRARIISFHSKMELVLVFYLLFIFYLLIYCPFLKLSKNKTKKCFSFWEALFWQPKVAVLAVISSVFDEGAKSGCLVGRALHHHQRTPPQALPQKFICPLKLLGLSCLRLSVKVQVCQ